VFAGYRRPFWATGGWAVDLHAGKVRRHHGGVDILIHARDLDEFDRVFAARGILVTDHQTGTEMNGVPPREPGMAEAADRELAIIDPQAADRP
jgi:hypothetical protein